MTSELTAEAFVKLKGCLYHYRDKRQGRIVTIAFFVDPVNVLLYYGASVWQPASSKEHWNRKDHNAFALERLLKSPVIVTDPCVGEFAPITQVTRAKNIREVIMMERGCMDVYNSDVDTLQELVLACEEKEKHKHGRNKTR